LPVQTGQNKEEQKSILLQLDDEKRKATAFISVRFSFMIFQFLKYMLEAAILLELG
jgi:hypothetical protein